MTTKQVQIIARYEIKANGYIVYKVRSSNGNDTYLTTLDSGGHATGCTCPSHVFCYHMKQLEVIEAARTVTAKIEKANKLRAQAALRQARLARAQEEACVVRQATDAERTLVAAGLMR